MCQKEAREPQDPLPGTQALVLGTPGLACSLFSSLGACALGNVILLRAAHVLFILGPHIDFPALSYRLHLQLP